MSTRDASWKVKAAATLPSSRAESVKILGASNSWSPKGLSRPVMGLLYLDTSNYPNPFFLTRRRNRFKKMGYPQIFG